MESGQNVPQYKSGSLGASYSWFSIHTSEISFRIENVYFRKVIFLDLYLLKARRKIQHMSNAKGGAIMITIPAWTIFSIYIFL